MTEEQKTYFWGYRMWEFHWGLSILMFLMFIPLTVAILIKHGIPQTTAHWVIVGWGLFGGLIHQAWTPMIIKYRRKWKRENL